MLNTSKKSTFLRLYYGKSGVVPGSGAGKAWVVRGPGDFCEATLEMPRSEK